MDTSFHVLLIYSVILFCNPVLMQQVTPPIWRFYHNDLCVQIVGDGYFQKCMNVRFGLHTNLILTIYEVRFIAFPLWPVLLIL